MEKQLDIYAYHTNPKELDGYEMLNDIHKEVDSEGTIRYINKFGNLHRLDGPAVERDNGVKSWYINGNLHREDGPAVVWPDGEKFWYQNGKKHRLDGPAVEWSDSDKEWYINGDEYTEKEFLKKTNK